MKRFHCLMPLLCPLLATAQPVLTSLSTGDAVPDLHFTQVLNAPYTSTSIADYPSQLLLLDFWATWCSSCVQEFPKMDSLRQQFSGQMSILLVDNPGSGDTKAKVLALMARKKLSLPVVMDGERLNQLFPHRSLPHTVWIYRGRILAITEASAVTAPHIRAVLDGRPAYLPVKKEQLDFDAQAPLLEGGNGGDITAALSRSLFTRYLEGAGGATGQSGLPGHLKRWFFINQPILNLYGFCFPGFTPNRIALQGLPEADYFQEAADPAWREKHQFCYELVVPDTVSLERVREIMTADLNRQFGVDAAIQTIAVSCYSIGQQAPYRQQAGSCGSYSGITRDEKDHWKACHQTMEAFTAQLNWQRSGKPHPLIIDETGYTEPVDLELGIPDLHDLPALRAALERYGFSLSQCTRNLPMLLITKH